MSLDLAKNIEYYMSEDDAAYVTSSQSLFPDKNYSAYKFSGGCACFTNNDPLTNTHGFGLLDSHNEILLTEIEIFFEQNRSPSTVSLPAEISKKIELLLLSRGYYSIKLMNIFILNELKSLPLNKDISILEVNKSDLNLRQLWEKIVSCGFSNSKLDLNITADTISQGQSIKQGNRLFIAYLNGNIAGASSLYINQEFARLGGMTTLPEFRGSGVQKYLIKHRVNLALQEGCSIITTNTMPDNTSHKNVEKCGFKLAYIRTTYQKNL